jgi:hypothetical protein
MLIKLHVKVYGAGPTNPRPETRSTASVEAST